MNLARLSVRKVSACATIVVSACTNFKVCADLQTLRNLCNHYAFVELSSFRGHFSCLKSIGAWQSSSDTYFLRVATGRRSRFVHGKNTSRLLNLYLASDATMQLAIIPIVSGPLSTKYVVIHLPNISQGVKFLLLSFCCCIL